MDEVWRLDLVVEEVLKEGPEIWLAVEISAVMDRNDVERAARRAGLLRRLGRLVVAAVAGEEVTEGGVGGLNLGRWPFSGMDALASGRKAFRPPWDESPPVIAVSRPSWDDGKGPGELGFL